MTDALVERYRVLARDLEHVTLVFDKGNNSDDNLARIAASPYQGTGHPAKPCSSPGFPLARE